MAKYELSKSQASSWENKKENKIIVATCLVRVIIGAKPGQTKK